MPGPPNPSLIRLMGFVARETGSPWTLTPEGDEIDAALAGGRVRGTARRGRGTSVSDAVVAAAQVYLAEIEDQLQSIVGDVPDPDPDPSKIGQIAEWTARRDKLAALIAAVV